MIMGGRPVGARLGGITKLHLLAKVGDAQHGIDEAHSAGDAESEHKLVCAVIFETAHEGDEPAIDIKQGTRNPQRRTKRHDRQALPSRPAPEELQHPFLHLHPGPEISSNSEMFIET